MTSRYEAGTWPVDYSVTDQTIFTTDAQGTSETPSAFQASMEEMAVNILWNFTNRIFSTYQMQIRPEQANSYMPVSTYRGLGPNVPYPITSPGGAWMPILYNGQWFNLNVGSEASPLQRWSIELPGEVVEVTEVQINGVVLDPSTYWLDGNTLNRTDDDWPTDQDMRYPLGAAGQSTWGITYTRGIAVPSGGQLAAGVLAVELAKVMKQDKTSLIPARIQTATRNSSTSTVVDVFQQLDKQRTGIAFVDNWIASVNTPERHAASVRSVDTSRKMAPGRWTA